MTKEKFPDLKYNGEFEFKENGTLNLYNEGKIMFSSAYSLATDGKSFVINAPSGESLLNFDILTIHSKSLVLIPMEKFRPGKDTLYFKPKRKSFLACPGGLQEF